MVGQVNVGAYFRIDSYLSCVYALQYDKIKGNNLLSAIDICKKEWRIFTKSFLLVNDIVIVQSEYSNEIKKYATFNDI